MSAVTTQKYLSVAFCDGVERAPNNGSAAGGDGSLVSGFFDACQKVSAPIPASSARMLTPLQTTESLVGRLPTSSSCGQLLVYETSSFGRLVVAAQADQKKKAESARSRAGS